MDYSIWLLPILCIALGIYNLFKIRKVYQDPKSMEEYVKNSPKALIWRKLFGIDKTIKLTKSIFLPLGIALGIILILLGVILIMQRLI